MLVPILKRIGIGVAAATLLVVAAGLLLLPRTYGLSRSIVIAAPQDQVHALCEDLEQWPRWAPWFQADPGLAVTTGPVTRGPGARQTWDGKSSRGQVTFTGSDPDSGVAFDLVLGDDGRPAVSRLRYAVVDSGIQVTWDLQGDGGFNPLQRFVGLMMGPYLGPMFDEGLARMKLEAEEAAADTTG